MRHIGQILVLFWQGAICGARQSWLRWVSLGIRWLGKAVKDGKSSRVQAGSGKGVQALAGQRSQGWQGRQVEARQRSQVQSRFGGSRCGRRGIGNAVRVSLDKSRCGRQGIGKAGQSRPVPSGFGRAR